MFINASLIVQMIVFLLLVGFTMKFVWPPITKALDERAAKIAAGLSAADKAKAELAGAEAQIAKELAATKAESGKLIADAEKRAAAIVDAAKGRALAITPVPKGVGPMTIACLLNNTIKAFCLQNGLPAPEGV